MTNTGRLALRATRADWAPFIESTTRTVVSVAVACYVAGEMLGQFVHTASTQLAAAYRCLLLGHRHAEAVVEAAIEVVAPKADRILEATGLPLVCLNVVELRALARKQLGSAARLDGRRIAQARRDDLLAALA